MHARKLKLISVALAVVGLTGACAPAAEESGEALTVQVRAQSVTTTVSGSGPVQASQTASLAWQLTGQVDQVYVAVGDVVQARQVLMTVDPASAPQANVQALADLISAQRALSETVTPTDVMLATQEKTVADARQALRTAERTLNQYTNPNYAELQRQVQTAHNNLITAQQNQRITNVGAAEQAVLDAALAVTNTLGVLNEQKQYNTLYPGCCGTEVQDAQRAYDQAVRNLEVARLQQQQALTVNTQAVTDATRALERAQANLAAANNPNAIRLAQAQADYDLAAANLAQAERKLAEMQAGGRPEDVRAAEARVEGAQVLVNQLRITAPFAGVVAAVNYKPGDVIAAQGAPVAVVLVNRSQMSVNVPVEESDVARLEVGDPVTVTVNALTGTTLTGRVEQIASVGETTNQLVRYPVRVVLDADHAALRVGMTANVTIVTDVQAKALVVPIGAVQRDDQGEFVMRLNPAGPAERVAIRTGQITGDDVIVQGDLQPGDTLELPAAPDAAPSGIIF
jgi:RND family efflux transporter MFP subunit